MLHTIGPPVLEKIFVGLGFYGHGGHLRHVVTGYRYIAHLYCLAVQGVSRLL